MTKTKPTLTTIKPAYPDSTAPEVFAQWGEARALHHRDEEDAIDSECVDGGCEHVECERGDDPPTHKVSVCRHCFDMAVNVGDDELIPRDAMWPCPTAKALGAVV